MNIIHEYPLTRQMLQDFSKDELESLTVVRCGPGKDIIRKNTVSENIYIILEGVCNVMKDLPNGSTIINYQVSTLDILGIADITVPGSRCYSTICSVTPVILLQISKKDFLHYFSKYQSFSLFLFQNILNHLHDFMNFTTNCNSNSTQINIYYYLCERYSSYCPSYGPDYEGYVRIMENRQQISDFLNIDIRSLNWYLTKFKENREISIIHGKIHMDREQFNRMSANL